MPAVLQCKTCSAGQAVTKVKEWKEVVEKNAHRGGLWKIFGSEQFLREMWEHFTLNSACARRILADAAQEKQEGTQGQWQKESTFKEVLEQVKKRSADAVKTTPHKSIFAV